MQGKMDATIPQLPLEMAVIRLIGDLPEDTQVQAKESSLIKKLRGDKTKQPKEEPPKTLSESTDEDALKNSPLTITHLTEHWPRVMERVNTPSLRMSLKSAYPVDVDDFNITLSFDTKFHRDKVMEHDHRTELESIIKSIFNKHVKIHSKIKEFEIKAVAEDEETDNVSGTAAQIFGGKFVE
jgi:hypothetical protein